MSVCPMRCHLALLICNSAVHFSAVQYSVVHYSAVQCSAVQCSAVQCSAFQCSTSTVQGQCNAFCPWNNTEFQQLHVPKLALGLCSSITALPHYSVLFSSVRFSSVLCISLQSNATQCTAIYTLGLYPNILSWGLRHCCTTAGIIPTVAWYLLAAEN